MGEINIEKHQSIAQRYTNAILSIAKEKNAVEQIGIQLKEIADLFNQNKEVEGFFVSPIIKKEDKKEILSQSFENKIDENLYNFLNVLVDKNRMYLLISIENLYRKELSKLANTMNVEAISVIALDEDMKKALIEKMQKLTNKKINLVNTINKDIIGGVILSFDGKVIDGSVKTQLAKLQKQLI